MELPKPPKGNYQTPTKGWGESAFGGFGSFVKTQMGPAILSAFQGGGNVGKTVGGLLGEQITSGIAGKVGTALSSKLGSTIGGAIGSIIPGLGTLIGGLAGSFLGKGIGKLTSLFGGDAKKKREENAAATGSIEEMKKKLLDTYGSLENIKKAGGAAGAALADAWGSQGKAGLEHFTRLAEKFNQALADQKKKAEGLQTALSGVALRAKGFAAEMEKAATVQQEALKKAGIEDLTGKVLTHTAAQQTAFERLGLYAVASFAAVVKETGSVIQALDAVGGTLDTLISTQAQFGFTGSEAVQKLLGMRSVVEANREVFDSLDGLTQMLVGFGDAGMMTAELFQAIAGDIGAQFATLQTKGVDTNTALALMQPTLQKLWEAQQQFGAVTDETTASLLAQAEQQGLVGEGMKDVNQKILDVLIAIGDVLGAVIPSGLKTMSDEVAKTAQTLSANPIRIGVKFETDTEGIQIGDTSIDVTPFAKGGIVRRPTLGLFGEAGPEAVVPLNRLGSMLGDQKLETTVVVNLDGREVARSTAKYLPGQLKLAGGL